MNKKNKFWKSKKGDGYIVILGLIALFIVGIAYITFTQPFYEVFDSVNASASGFDPRAETTLYKIQSIWNWWPLIAFVSIILWMILNSIRRQPYEGYQ